jgi:hypothetical protein
MARARLYPHRLAAAEAVTWHDWWIERGDDRARLPSLLVGWDYASEETVGISVDVDPGALLRSTGLQTLDDLEVLVLGDCPSTQQRFVATSGLAGCRQGASVEVGLKLPSGQLAGAVRLSAHLVLARTTPRRSERVAFLRGSLLHSCDPFTMQLEGGAGRFPTEPAAFSELGLGNAPWTVLVVHHDLSAAFMGSVRLLINTEHTAGQLLLAATPDARVGRLLKADIVRLLIGSTARLALDSASGLEPEEGSLGQVLDTMCRLFLRRTLRTAARLYVEDPAQFDLALHDCLEPLAGLTA